VLGATAPFGRKILRVLIEKLMNTALANELFASRFS
jgi:hypothetical protein